MDSDRRSEIRQEVLERAEDVLAGIADQWGEFERSDPLEVVPLNDDDPSFPESAEEFFDEFYPYAAGAVVTDEQGRLLCVYSRPRDEWETPGGAGEKGETPAETARRETREETGIEIELLDVLHARFMEVDMGEPETLPIPVVGFAARPVGGGQLRGAEIDAHEEISNLDWFEADELPEIREYERKYEYLRSLEANSSR